MWVAVHTTVCTLPKYFAQIISAVFSIKLFWPQILNSPTFHFSMVLHPGTTNIHFFPSYIHHIICRILVTMRALCHDIKFLKAWVLPTKVLPTISWHRHYCAEVAKRQVFGPYIYPNFDAPFTNSSNGKDYSHIGPFLSMVS